MLRVVCVQKGNYLGRGAEYVNVLFDQVRRNLPEGTEGEFVCFTDDGAGLHDVITVRPLPDGLVGWWNKLWLFSPGLFPDGDRIIYFDLDTLIVGALDELAGYSGEFAALRDFYRPDGLQSAVMAWRSGAMTHLWTDWVEAGKPEIAGGDQAWVEANIARADLLQELFPGKFVSFKAHCEPYPPKGAAVVCFHGLPRPHEIAEGWVPLAWKVGGIGSVEIDVICNTETEILKENCRKAMALDRPELVQMTPHGEHVCIVGGGPSVAGYVPELKARSQNGQKIWALNGAAKFLQEQGVMVDAQWIVDARPSNARFVVDGPVKFIASQCAPEVFDAAGARAVIFHDLNCGPWLPEGVTLIGGGSTVGLKAIAGAYVLGCRSIHLYGMDSCFENDAHHAYDQPENDADRRITVHVEGGGTFVAAPWMIRQVEEFQQLAAFLANDGAAIHVHCGGLLGHVAVEMVTPRIGPADQRAGEILKRIDGVESPVGVEIGVFAGDTSCRLLQHPTLTLYMVDSWEGGGDAYAAESGDWHARLTLDQQTSYERMARKAVEAAGPRARIVKARSAEAAESFPDAMLDFAFIDADHSYEGCAADIAAWLPKVKPGGVIGGHDYDNHDFPGFGVNRAVDEFCSAHGLALEKGENFTWFVRLPGASALAA